MDDGAFATKHDGAPVGRDAHLVSVADPLALFSTNALEPDAWALASPGVQKHFVLARQEPGADVVTMNE